MKIENKEFDLFRYLKILNRNIKLILLVSLLGLIFGVFHSLTIDNKYESKTIILPQLSNSAQSSSSISSFAKAAGFNLKSQNFNKNEIPPNLYPLLLESVEVKNEILGIENNKKSLKSIIDEYYPKSKTNFISSFKSFFVSLFYSKSFDQINSTQANGLFYISTEDQFYFDILNDIIFISLNENEGFIEISSLFPDPFISAFITENTKNILQEKIINFKIQSASETVKYLEKNYLLKKNELKLIEKKLAKFKDKNQSISSSTYNIELVSLESEYNLIKGVYSQIASQLEDAKLELNKNTPTFTIIDPVRIPNSKSYPNRTQIVLIYFIIFFIVISGYLLFRDKINLIIKKIK